MANYLSTFISLFGSISAINIAFLIILYDALKKKTEKSKLNFTNEVTSFINCSHTNRLGLFNSENNTHLKFKLLSEYTCGRLSKEKTEEVILMLKTTINDVNTSEADKQHLKKYHLDDIEYELKLYNQDKNYLDNKFYKFAKISIGVPFIFTSLFILIAEFNCELLCLLSTKLFDYLIILICFFGFLFIYSNAIEAVKNLNKID